MLSYLTYVIRCSSVRDVICIQHAAILFTQLALSSITILASISWLLRCTSVWILKSCAQTLPSMMHFAVCTPFSFYFGFEITPQVERMNEKPQSKSFYKLLPIFCGHLFVNLFISFVLDPLKSVCGILKKKKKRKSHKVHVYAQCFFASLRGITEV